MGSLALGGAIGTVASIRQNLLPSSVIFIIEALSVLLQVAATSCAKSASSKCTPHHHFEQLGERVKIIARLDRRAHLRLVCAHHAELRH
jgi:UDP-N-acetylmuramyl pentapeptide phosphotransferase/UDP-N-acetylglucosamine-1-phosphate transferase